MTVLMGERRADVLERASDLGIAMQLTNIARDVGADARRGRIYLPLSWLAEAGVEPTELVGAPRMSPQLGMVVRRLLAEADKHYRLAEPGVRRLPRDCRLAIAAAARIYRDIGRVIVKNGYDSVSHRAHTSSSRKAWLLLASVPAFFGRTRSSSGPSGPSAVPEAGPLILATSGASR
jgi:phytoene synthase